MASSTELILTPRFPGPWNLDAETRLGKSAADAVILHVTWSMFSFLCCLFSLLSGARVLGSRLLLKYLSYGVNYKSEKHNCRTTKLQSLSASNKWDSVNMNPRYGGGLISIDGILLDEDGNMAQISVPKRFEKQFCHLLAKGSVYIISDTICLSLSKIFAAIQKWYKGPSTTFKRRKDTYTFLGLLSLWSAASKSNWLKTSPRYNWSCQWCWTIWLC